MKFTNLIFVTILLLGPTSCRTTWVHPEATQQKYAHDSYKCQYGTEPPSAEQIRGSGTLPVTERRRDWKACMALLGWSRDTRMRSSEPWGTP
jgi:hypothetical protein